MQWRGGWNGALRTLYGVLLVAEPVSVPGSRSGRWQLSRSVPPPLPTSSSGTQALTLAKHLAPPPATAAPATAQLPQLNTCPAGHAGSREGGTAVARDVQRESSLRESGDRAAGRRGKAYSPASFMKEGLPGEMLFRQVSGEPASPCGEEGGEVQGQLVGRMVLDQTPSPGRRVRPGAEQDWQRKAQEGVTLKRHPDLF